MTSTRFFAILPAAGRSARMGRPKLLLPWQGRTIWQHVLAAWTNTTCDLKVAAVVHPDDAEVAEQARAAGVDVVQPVNAPEDMKASIRLGLAHLRAKYSPADDDAWLVAPADMPRLRSAIIETVMTCYDPRHPMVIVPEHRGKRGHPVLFPWALAAEVDKLATNEGLNRLVDRSNVSRLPLLDNAILTDLDTPEDYQKLTDG